MRARYKGVLSHASIGLALAAMVSGCAAIDHAQGQWRVDSVYQRKDDKPTDEAVAKNPDAFKPIVLETLTFPVGYNPCGAASTLAPYSCAMTNALARDWIQDRIIELSLKVCEQHKGDITANAAIINSSLGIATAGLAGLGAVVSGEGAKSALAGAAGFTGATQAILNQEIYQKYVGPAIVNSIEGDRKNALEEIYKKRRKAKAGSSTGETEPTEITNYSANEAIRDAVDFHQRCSFYHGLSLLLESSKRVEVTDDEINTKINKLREQVTALRALQTPLLVDGKAPTVKDNPSEYAQYSQLGASIATLQAQIEREAIALAAKPVR